MGYCLLCGSLLLAVWQEAVAQRPYDLPTEPIEFAAHEPNRPNALDLLATVNGYAFLRYQRAISSNFSLIFDLNSYFHLANVLWLLSRNQFMGTTINRDIRGGLGLGLAFWPWEKLRKAYIALHSQLQLQFLQVTTDGAVFTRNRFLLGNSLEIGARLGRKVASFGLFGGLGFQVSIDGERILPEGYSLPMIYAYFGLSLGLTFS